MAIIRLGAMVSSISGKIGGQSFVNGSQGTYLKNNGNISKSPTVSQSLVRVSTAKIMSFWSTLSTAQKNTFTAQVGNYNYLNRVGEAKSYNAFQIFMLLNQGRSLINLPYITTGPSPSAINVPVTSFISLKYNALIIKGATSYPNQTFVLWATPPLQQGISNVQSMLRRIAIVSNSDFFSGYDFTDDYLAVFPNLAPNQRIGVSLQSFITASGEHTDKRIAIIVDTTS